MFERVFNKKAFALTAALMTAAAPAIADGVSFSNQLHKNSATAAQWVKDGCPDPQNVPQCDNHLVITTYSDVQKNQDWARAGFDTALRLYNEGKEKVFYVMANDNNSNPQDALMSMYVNGKDLKLGVGLTVEYGFVSNLHMDALGTKDLMYQEADKAYRLAHPQIAANFQ